MGCELEAAVERQLAGFERAAVLFPLGLILVVDAGDVAEAGDAGGQQVAALPEIVAIAEVHALRDA